MIEFSKEELFYIKEQLNQILIGEDEPCVIARGFLDEQDIKDIQHFIDSVDKVNSDEDENKKFIDVVIKHLGMWCFVDAEYTYDELLELINDRQYCDLFKKLILDKEEE